MEEKETKTKESIEYILESISQLLSQDNHTNVGDISFIREPMAIYASPEEGVRLILGFVRIKQPELRAAIIKLATQIADVRAFTKPVQN